MKLNECLNHASVDTLRSIALYQEIDCSLYSKLDLMQSILYAMRIRAHVYELTKRWVQEWGDLMTRISMSNRHVFSAEEIDALFMATGFEANALHRALSQGWLFARRTQSLRPTYIIPMEVHETIRKYLFDQMKGRVVVRTTPPLIQQDEATCLVQDFQTFIDYVSNHEIQLTTGGAMYKRHVQRLMELFSVPEDLTIPEWRFGYGRRTHDYPDRLALLYDFAYDQNFVIETDEQTLVVSDAIREWTALSRAQQMQRILQFYIRLYRRPIPRLREIVEVIRTLAQEWVESNSVLAACGSMVSQFYYDSREAVWNQRILKMLTHLGVIRLGFDQESDEQWFQMTNLGQELLTQDELQLVDETSQSQASIIVQPNFEVMVTVHDSQVESVLSQFADLLSAGSIRIYRILEQSVQRGLAAGYDFARWRATLAKASIGPIPGNVERTLIEWETMHASERPLSS
ncbi:helicase-associated domain-containing protein [Alicyclobacillus suci]|uniref:helicase-associated domain-containing protein n=1 Tax=Alicyclobacillus suci TaxID=2816080 RepID=UPI001A8C0EE4|nr:helicase-associated domain-containing protein [Alicyclobacillus suci]